MAIARIIDRPLIRHSKHSRMIKKILELTNRVQDNPQVLAALEPSLSSSPHSKNIKSYTPFPKLEPSQFPAGQRPNQALVDLAERNLRRPRQIGGGFSGNGVEDEDYDLRFLGA